MKTYRISELGKRFGLARSTLLYYDHIGVLCPSGRTQADYRLYTQEDLEKLERICALRETGLGLSEIARLLENDNDNCTVLERRLREIGREMAVLRSQQRVIAGMLKAAAGLDAPGLDQSLWLSLQKACGLDKTALKRWHAEFECRAPGAHHDFLLSLGLSEKEAIQVRRMTKSVEDNNTKMKYFFEVFEYLPRQGPGCLAATLGALALLTDLPAKPHVLDIGCGCGMQTLVLARALNTKVMAIDNHRPMLDRLERAAAQEGLNIETHELSMLAMPFDEEFFDLLWAEGSLFIIGIARGLQDFRRFLKPSGYLAFTEICWLVDDPADEVRDFFGKVYPDIKRVAEIQQLATGSGYRLIDSFRLPDSAWWDDYYTPMLARVRELKSKNAGVAEAQTVYAECETEAEMFRKYSTNYGYVFFVLQRV
jgi:DNA-binding transcriptional MerR regulator/SAM-dependent methyltransferase